MARQRVDPETLLNIQKRVEEIPGTALAKELQDNAQVLVRQPDNISLHFGMGLMYGRIGDFESAVKMLGKAQKLSRGHPIILGALAYIYANQLGDHATAIKFLRKRIQNDKRDVSSYLLIANSHMRLSEPEKALEALNKAQGFAQGESLQRLLAIRSQCYQRVGDFDSAKSDLLKMAESDPSGLLSVADVLAKMPNTEPELLAKLRITMTDALNDKNAKFRDSIHEAMTANALAKIEEGEGNYKVAFSYFTIANELQGKDEGSWAHDETNEFEIYKQVFDKELFSNLPQGHQSEKQIFIIGMPRSGTTLLESILGSNDNVKNHGELEHFVEQQHRLGFTSEKNPDPSKRATQVRKFLTSAPEHGFVEIGDLYLKRYGFDKDPRSFHVDKMPHNFRALGLISAVFPKAKIVHTMRHPMDVCLSNYQNLLSGYNTTFRQNLEKLGNYYLEYIALMKHWEEVLPTSIHKTRYEDLVSDTPTHAKEVTQYCGIEWNESSLNKRKTRGDVNTASMWQVRKDIYASSVGKWWNYESELQPLREILRDEIERYEAGL